MVTISFEGETEEEARANLRAAVLAEFPVLSYLRECSEAPSGNGNAGVLFIDRAAYRVYLSTGEAESLKEIATI